MPENASCPLRNGPASAGCEQLLLRRAVFLAGLRDARAQFLEKLFVVGAHGRWTKKAGHETTLDLREVADSTQFGCDALALVAPASTELLQMAAQRGHNLGSITAAQLRLLDQYGAPLLQAAMVEAITNTVNPA